MDSLTEKLHSAARLYCVKWDSIWQTRYVDLQARGEGRDGIHYSELALDTFPRYNTLRAILAEIETFVPQDFSSIEEAKELLTVCAFTAESIFTINPIGPMDKLAMAQERQSFVQWLTSVTEEEILQTATMPFRRVLTSREKEEIRSRFLAEWSANVKGHWFPDRQPPTREIGNFQQQCFDEEVGSDTARRILSDHGIRRLWEFTENSPAYELGLSYLDLTYAGQEAYWCSEMMDWIVYVSHEGMIAVGGWLLAEFKKVWPNWQDCIWMP